MKNNIFEIQNKQENIQKLAAQKTLYSYAKRQLGLFLILSIPVTILLSLATFFLKKYSVADISLYAACYSITLAFFDLVYFTPRINHFKKSAAGIQELFDTSVYAMEWNSILIGNMPDSEDIIEHSKNKNQKHYENLKNWYFPSAVDLSNETSILLCQKMNCTYDKKLKNGYMNMFYVFSAILFILLFILSISIKITVLSLLSQIIAPFMPLFIFTIKLRHDVNNHTLSITHIYRVITTMLDRLKNKQAPVTYSSLRQIQDAIYFCRVNSPLVFDWFYKIKRKTFEQNLHYVFQDDVKKYV